MRQTDGSELLGTNDPRSSEIGIIHVTPNDDRQSVLAAILTQDKLGAKQTVVVLPEENKAFQRPVDFEGLKNMRRGLKTQIVFVASPGPGPAEFARQRRFPVYSSLESYGQSLKAENATSVRSQKGGWLFGRRQKVANAPVTPSQTSTEREREQAVPLNRTSTNWAKPEQVPPREPSQLADEQRDTDHIGEVALGGAGLAAGLGLGALAAHDVQDGMPPGSEDWDALPPAGTTPQVASGSLQEMSPQPVNSEPQTGTPTDARGSPEPGISAFPPPRPRNSGKVPVPPIAPVPTGKTGVPSTNMPVRRGNTGKRAAIPAAAMGAGTGAAMFGSTAGGGNPPSGTGGVPGSGRGRSRSRRNILLALLVLLLATLLCVTGFAFAAPKGMLNIVPVGGPPPATATITPKSSDQKNTYGIMAVTGKPDPTKRQVQARLLSSNITKSDSTNATGTRQTPGVPAKGMLTFYNGKTQVQTVAAYTKFTDPQNGIQVMNIVMATIPAAKPPTEGSVTVAAQAVNVGASGNNVKAGEIYQTCCSADNTITVTNLSDFGGGQDPETFTVVQQADIDRIAGPLKASTLSSAKQGVTSQVQANEQLVSDPQCSTNVTSDHNAGDRATTVSVTVTTKCSAEVYDLRGPQGAQALATNLLNSDVAKNPNLANYVLTGSIVTTVTQTTVNSDKTISLFVKAEGIWVYQFNDASKADLAKLIAGKSKSEAETLLANAAGVAKVDSIDISGGGSMLPTDPKQITINVLGVPGLQGTPTTPPGPGGPTATPTSQNGLGGS